MLLLDLIVPFKNEFESLKEVILNLPRELGYFQEDAVGVAN